MRIGSLFSGIGGLDLGLERGLHGRTLFQVEIEDFPRWILSKRFPYADQHRDVCEVGAHNLPEVDVLCGGPPCQSWSVAGKRGGFDDARGRLSLEYLRIVGEMRPAFVVIENVPGFRKAMPTIVSGLNAQRYVVQWDVLPAAVVGAPHLRERFFIVGMRNGGVLDFAAAMVDDYWPDLEVYPSLATKTPYAAKRLRALGNAVVPKVAEVVGRAIGGWRVGIPLGARELGVHAEEMTKVPRAGYATLEGDVWVLSPSCAGVRGGVPTPTASMSETKGELVGYLRGTRGCRRLPTPTTFDSVGRRTGTSPYVTWTGSVRSRREDGRTSNLGLAGMTELLPTPVTNDSKNASLPPSQGSWDSLPGALIRGGHKGYLNPEFVEWMMGFDRRWTEP